VWTLEPQLWFFSRSFWKESAFKDDFHRGGRDQEDCSSRPAQANSSRDPISTNKNAGPSGVLPSSQVHKKYK
jgi:hypothetical protein